MPRRESSRNPAPATRNRLPSLSKSTDVWRFEDVLPEQFRPSTDQGVHEVRGGEADPGVPSPSEHGAAPCGLPGLCVRPDAGVPSREPREAAGGGPPLQGGTRGGAPRRSAAEPSREPQETPRGGTTPVRGPRGGAAGGAPAAGRGEPGAAARRRPGSAATKPRAGPGAPAALSPGEPAEGAGAAGDAGPPRPGPDRAGGAL